MKRVLVTGAQGFVGRYLVAELLETEPEARVVGIGRSRELPGAFSHGGPLPNGLAHAFRRHGERYRYVSAQLTDTKALRALVRDLRPDCVFHLASALHSARETDLMRTNVEGTLGLLNALEDHEALLVHGSSASVYGEPRRVPIRENDPCEPTTIYGLSKWAAERLLAMKAGRMGLRSVVARIFNIVGPGQTAAHVCGRLVEQLVAIERGAASTLEIGPLDPTRDFVDVRDVVRALLVMARRAAPGETYNVGSGREVSIREVLRMLVRISGVEARVDERRDHPAGVSRHVADVSKLTRIGFVPEWALLQSLSDLLEDHRRIAQVAKDVSLGDAPMHPADRAPSAGRPMSRKPKPASVRPSTETGWPQGSDPNHRS